MVETEHLIVRNASFADLDTFAEWESRDDVIEHFCLDRKRDLDTLTDDFHDVTHDPSRKWLTIMLKGNRKPIGRIGINDIDPINNSMNLKIIYIGDACYRGKGYGSESIRAVLEYAFSEMDLHRVAIDHFLDDVVSEHLYDSIGFRKEGIMKNAGRQGNDYSDLQMRAILKEEWEEQKEILKAKEPEKVPQVIADYL